MSARYKFLKKGAPFAVLVIVSPYLLKQFNSVRYQYRKTGMLTREEQLRVKEVEEAKKAGVAVDETTNAVLEKARNEAQKDWSNIRGPRPWEDSREVQRKSREQAG